MKCSVVIFGKGYASIKYFFKKGTVRNKSLKTSDIGKCLCIRKCPSTV